MPSGPSRRLVAIGVGLTFLVGAMVASVSRLELPARVGPPSVSAESALVEAIVGLKDAEASSLCALTSGGLFHDGAVVRTTGHYVAGDEWSYIADAHCDTQRVWVEFDDVFIKRLTRREVSGEFERLAAARREREAKSGNSEELTLNGTFVGQFYGPSGVPGGYGHLGAYGSCLESSPSSLSKRTRGGLDVSAV